MAAIRAKAGWESEKRYCNVLHALILQVLKGWFWILYFPMFVCHDSSRSFLVRRASMVASELHYTSENVAEARELQQIHRCIIAQVCQVWKWVVSNWAMGWRRRVYDVGSLHTGWSPLDLYEESVWHFSQKRNRNGSCEVLRRLVDVSEQQVWKLDV